MEPITIEAREDGRIAVRSEFRDKDLVQEIPGALWDQEPRCWHLPLSWAAMVQSRGVFGDRLEIGPGLWDLAAQVRQLRIDPCLALREAPDCEWIVDPSLTPLQRAGAGFMATARQAINSDPMGAGKCAQTIHALRKLQEMGEDPFPALIICPNGVKAHWRNEFSKWWPGGPTVSIVAGTPAKRRKALEVEAEVYVINYEVLPKHSAIAGYGSIRLSDEEKTPKELNGMGLRTVVSDEAHRLKDPKSKQTRASWKLGDSAEFRYALTGTLIANSPDELWPIGRFVAPTEYPSKVKFVDRYGVQAYSHLGYQKVVGLREDTREELFRFLDPRMIRRPKKLILPQLPEKLPPTVRVVDLGTKQRKAYRSLRDQMMAELDGGVLVASNPLKQMLRLRQLAAATGEIGEDGEVSLKEPSSKLDELVAVLEEAGDEKVVVFAESRKLIELAAARLAKVGVGAEQFTGANVDEREAHRIAFQTGDLRVLLVTLGAGAEGIDLSAADIEVFLERSWSAVKNAQAEDRADRGDRAGPLRIVNIVAADTVDDYVDAAYGAKLDRLEEVVRDEETLRRWLS